MIKRKLDRLRYRFQGCALSQPESVSANGNLAALLTTGITLTEERSYQPELEKRDNVKVLNGNYPHQQRAALLSTL
jgi:hypothetical protein